MQNFDYMTPTRLIFGKESIVKLPSVMAQSSPIPSTTPRCLMACASARSTTSPSTRVWRMPTFP